MKPAGLKFPGACGRRHFPYLNGFDLRMVPLEERKTLYAGKVDHGFDKVSAADPRKRLEPPVRKTQPYSERITSRMAALDSIGASKGERDLLMVCAT